MTLQTPELHSSLFFGIDAIPSDMQLHALMLLRSSDVFIDCIVKTWFMV